jgi:proteic killer suppression protein
LDILFESNNLKELCHDEKLATRTLGPESTRKLRARLDDLASAATLAYCRKLPGHFHALTGGRAGQFSFRLHGGHRLVIKPESIPTAGREVPLDLNSITRIKVMWIGNYHD